MQKGMVDFLKNYPSQLKNCSVANYVVQNNKLFQDFIELLLYCLGGVKIYYKSFHTDFPGDWEMKGGASKYSLWTGPMLIQALQRRISEELNKSLIQRVQQQQLEVAHARPMKINA